MLGQIGLWQDGLDVAFGPKMMDWLDAEGTDRRVSLSCLVVDAHSMDRGWKRHRSLIVAADPRGPIKVCLEAASRCLAYDHHATFQSNQDHETLACLDLPRFGLHEVEWSSASALSDLGQLAVTLPDDHALPWPTRVEDEYLEGPLEEDLFKRLVSTIRCGLKAPEAPMPNSLRDRLPKGVWVNALDRARSAGPYTPQGF